MTNPKGNITLITLFYIIQQHSQYSIRRLTFKPHHRSYIQFPTRTHTNNIQGHFKQFTQYFQQSNNRSNFPENSPKPENLAIHTSDFRIMICTNNPHSNNAILMKIKVALIAHNSPNQSATLTISTCDIKLSFPT